MTDLDLDHLEALCSPTTPEGVQALFTGAASALPALIAAARERDRLRQRIAELARLLADAEITAPGPCGSRVQLAIHDDGEHALARVVEWRQDQP